MSVQFTKAIKFVLAIALLICLADMPYGYFQLVRFLALVGFALLAYAAYENHESTAFIVYVGLAILFQPLLKIALGRTIWNILDVIVGIVLLVSMFSTPLKKTDT